jgi:hypothetical protein
VSDDTKKADPDLGKLKALAEAAKKLPIVAWLVDEYDSRDKLHQSVGLSPLASHLDESAEAEPLCTVESAQAVIDSFAALVAQQAARIAELEAAAAPCTPIPDKYLGKWCYSHNEEEYTGTFDSEQDAIAEAREYSDTGTFWIGQCGNPADALSAKALGESIMQTVDEWAYEECGGDDQIFEMNDEDAEKLGQLALSFIKREASVGRYAVVNVVRHDPEPTATPEGK